MAVKLPTKRLLSIFPSSANAMKSDHPSSELATLARSMRMNIQEGTRRLQTETNLIERNLIRASREGNLGKDRFDTWGY